MSNMMVTGIMTSGMVRENGPALVSCLHCCLWCTEWHDTDNTYLGEWLDNFIHGKGKYTSSNGQEYEVTRP